VFTVLGARIRAAGRRVLGSVVTAVREAFRPAPVETGFVQDLFRSQEDLVAENATFGSSSSSPPAR